MGKRTSESSKKERARIRKTEPSESRPPATLTLPKTQLSETKILRFSGISDSEILRRFVEADESYGEGRSVLYTSLMPLCLWWMVDGWYAYGEWWMDGHYAFMLYAIWRYGHVDGQWMGKGAVKPSFMPLCHMDIRIDIMDGH